MGCATYTPYGVLVECLLIVLKLPLVVDKRQEGGFIP